MKIRIIATAAFTLLLAYGFSLSGSADINPCDIRAELAAQMKDYSIKEIIPQKKLWKKTLDKAMSAKDLKSLNRLRSEATVINSSSTKAIAEIKINGVRSGETVFEAEKKIYDRRQSKIKRLFDKLAPLRNNYRSEINQIVAEAKTMSIKWRTEMTAIQKKWELKNKNLTDDQPGRKHSEGRQTGLRSGRGRGMGGQGRGQGRGMGGQGRGVGGHESHTGDRRHSNYENNELRQFRNHLDPIYLIPDNLSDSAELYNFMLWDGTLPKDNKKEFDQENDSDDFEDFENGN
ncbi:MAG: hypothetical protein KAH48_11260 [Chlorobi bacterium]|nr:hypothetical protein [Chlorobiota bacterium]